MGAGDEGGVEALRLCFKTDRWEGVRRKDGEVESGQGVFDLGASEYECLFIISLSMIQGPFSPPLRAKAAHFISYSQPCPPLFSSVAVFALRFQS